MDILRWFIGGAGVLVFLWLAGLNARAFVRCYITRREVGTMTPLAGGIAGAVSFLIIPTWELHAWWWLPLVLDTGSGPLMLAAFLFWLKRGRKAKSGTCRGAACASTKDDTPDNIPPG
jgi:hypothetical protein